MSPQNDIIAKLVEVNLETADRTPGQAKRGQHPKHHGCVKAQLSVGDWIPQEFKIGLFAEAKTFVGHATMGPTWFDEPSPRSRETAANGIGFFRAPRYANLTAALLLVFAAIASAALAVLLVTLDVHDSAIGWIICTG
jgi:hypothetical protein